MDKCQNKQDGLLKFAVNKQAQNHVILKRLKQKFRPLKQNFALPQLTNSKTPHCYQSALELSLQNYKPLTNRELSIRIRAKIWDQADQILSKKMRTNNYPSDYMLSPIIQKAQTQIESLKKCAPLTMNARKKRDTKNIQSMQLDKFVNLMKSYFDKKIVQEKELKRQRDVLFKTHENQPYFITEHEISLEQKQYMGQAVQHSRQINASAKKKLNQSKKFIS